MGGRSVRGSKLPDLLHHILCHPETADRRHLAIRGAMIIRSPRWDQPVTARRVRVILGWIGWWCRWPDFNPVEPRVRQLGGVVAGNRMGGLGRHGVAPGTGNHAVDVRSA